MEKEKKERLKHEVRHFTVDCVAEALRISFIFLVAGTINHEVSSKHDEALEAHVVATAINRAEEFHHEQLTLVRGELLALK